MKKPTDKLVSFTCEACGRDHYESTPVYLYSFMICELCRKRLPEKKQEVHNLILKALKDEIRRSQMKQIQENDNFDNWNT